MSTLIGRTAQAEWARIWSVRSSWIFAFATAAAVLGIGTMIGLDASSGPPPDGTAWDGALPTGFFALFGILAWATVCSTADHTSGGIIPTLQWTPRRGVLLVARATVIAATTAVVGLLLVTAAGLVIWAIVPAVGAPAGEAAGLIGRLAFVLTSGALLAVGIGLLTRSTAGALVTVLALMLILPFVLAQLSLVYTWLESIAAGMPGSSALYLVFGEGPYEEMTTTSARITLVAWVVGALFLGGLRLIRGDADR
ncbi:hypothetical protein [Nocardioides albus]|uniref:ABC-2 type transport system permease protein n=1 Tax=Nocardioides albus TaxID=1841 RepID=A0A7W5A7H3_9ACTN|nr:hypothetical protein [Nocardioides albus]MBB3091111.1 ABC-2 type transport system permease protein [Nocardioides albus]GGU34271.1 ABC transporter permease [Nocardioides albus]